MVSCADCAVLRAEAKKYRSKFEKLDGTRKKSKLAMRSARQVMFLTTLHSSQYSLLFIWQSVEMLKNELTKLQKQSIDDTSEVSALRKELEQVKSERDKLRGMLKNEAVRPNAPKSEAEGDKAVPTSTNTNANSTFSLVSNHDQSDSGLCSGRSVKRQRVAEKETAKVPSLQCDSVARKSPAATGPRAPKVTNVRIAKCKTATKKVRKEQEQEQEQSKRKGLTKKWKDALLSLVSATE